jgi:hypothetical protein
MIEELIARVFATRNAAHLEHWRTKSIGHHEALGDFYDGVLEALDSLVEAHQGLSGLVQMGELPAQPKVKAIAPHLESDMEWIAANRAKITEKMPALDNLLQDIEAHYLHALYKLNHLA